MDRGSWGVGEPEVSQIIMLTNSKAKEMDHK